jgi:hypothetical protein
MKYSIKVPLGLALAPSRLAIYIMKIKKNSSINKTKQNKITLRDNIYEGLTR